mmetsp:Transcript_109939/g.310095  ORF Transcript_109939/g.310095 Transcript_109939/m.310095 type:complete len:335 (-) Transcript_109939:53-1057(-)
MGGVCGGVGDSPASGAPVGSLGPKGAEWLRVMLLAEGNPGVGAAASKQGFLAGMARALGCSTKVDNGVACGDRIGIAVDVGAAAMSPRDGNVGVCTGEGPCDRIGLPGSAQSTVGTAGNSEPQTLGAVTRNSGNQPGAASAGVGAVTATWPSARAAAADVIVASGVAPDCHDDGIVAAGCAGTTCATLASGIWTPPKVFTKCGGLGCKRGLAPFSTTWGPRGIAAASLAAIIVLDVKSSVGELSAALKATLKEFTDEGSCGTCEMADCPAMSEYWLAVAPVKLPWSDLSGAVPAAAAPTLQRFNMGVTMFHDLPGSHAGTRHHARSAARSKQLQ